MMKRCPLCGRSSYSVSLIPGVVPCPTCRGAKRIIETAHADGAPWHQPNAILFEIAEGEHEGKRGPDSELRDLVGPIQWDRSEVVVYETGERRPAAEGEIENS